MIAATTDGVARAKIDARFRCVRCRHPFYAFTGNPRDCDAQCDGTRGRYLSQRVDLRLTFLDGTATEARDQELKILTLGGVHAPHAPGLGYGIVHLDGDATNVRWWNLLALCSACRQKLSTTVRLEPPRLAEDAAWCTPYLCGFFAARYGRLEITREHALAQPELYLAMGRRRAS